MNGNVSQAARDIRPKRHRRLADRIKPHEHEGQPATFWVRVYLLLGCIAGGLLLFVALRAWWLLRPLGEPVPNFSLLADHKIDKPVTAFDVVTRDRGGNADVVIADEERLHYGRSVKELFLWKHFPLANLRSQLPAPRVVALSAGDARSLFICQERDGVRRGVTAGTLPVSSDDLSFWSQPILDTSFFRGLDDEHAHCLYDEPGTRTRLVGALGLGVYDPPTRRWLGSFSPKNSDLSHKNVYDLEGGIPSGGIAVMGDGGIDLGVVTRHEDSDHVAWDQREHYDQTSGLVGNDVRHGRMVGPALVYVTSPGGLGRLHLGDDPPAPATRTLVAEGRAPGLTRDSLRHADEDRARHAMWMVYDTVDPPGNLAVANYETDGHRMIATSPDDSWPASEELTLAADPYGQASGVWIGGGALRNVTLNAGDPGQRKLRVRECGLSDREIDEIAVNQHAVFVRAMQREQGAPGDAHHPTIEAATRSQIDGIAGGAFRRPYVGNRRFPGLTDSDLSAACDAQAEGQSAIYFGTRGKGICAFLRGSREFLQVHHSEHPDPDCRVPCDSSLDLAAWGDHLVQVGSNRTLALFNGSNWRTLIAEGGIDIDPADVKAVVAQGRRLVVGTADKIGSYDTHTHQWTTIPPVENLERLAIGIDRLWAIDSEKKLHSLEFSNVADPSWREADRNVIDFYGDGDLVAVVAGTGLKRHLWVQPKNGAKRMLVSPRALPNKGGPWKAAAVAGGKLYVAPHDQTIGRYDLDSHEWESIPFPADDAMPLRELHATANGLWLLGGDDILYFRSTDRRIWEKTAENVKWLDTDGVDVIALARDGSVQRSANGGPPMATLVGNAFASRLDEAKAGIVFQDQLFVGTAERVGRYEVNRHSWHNYEGVEGVVQFAFTQGFLYGLTGQKELKRYSPGQDVWTDVVVEDGSVRLAQIAGNGSPALYILLETGRVLALFDNQPQAVTLIATTQLGEGAIGAAAELDRALFLGLNKGTVARYGKAPGKPWIWSPVFKSESPLRQLLVPNPAGEQLVAVGEKVWLLSATNGSGAWDNRTLLDERDIDGAVDATNFYGLQSPGDADAQIWRVSFAPNAGPVAYLGDRFPKNDSSDTAAIGASGTHELFRADADGTVARYEFDENGWSQQNIRDVRQFLRAGPQLWAWVPSEETLYRWTQTWNAADTDKNIQHAVGDGKDILMAKTDGTVLMRSATGETKLLEPLSNPLPIQDADIRAAAECGDHLFLAFQDKPLLAYDRELHRWREEPLRDIAELERLRGAGPASVLFGRGKDGQVHHCEATRDTWTSVDVPDGARAAKLVLADRSVVIQTEDGDIHLADAAGQICGSFQPQMIANRKAVDIKLSAAAELSGRLIILPDLDNGHELWRYDADAPGWNVEPIELGDGQPLHFLKANKLWLVVQSDEQDLCLYPVSDGSPMLQAPITNLLDAASDGKSIWVITDDHRVRTIDDNGKLVATGIPEASLPEGRTVHRAYAAADECGVLLDDGSVHHYEKLTRQWKERIPPLPAGVKPQTNLVLDSGRWLILYRPAGEVWACNIFNGRWQELPKNVDIPELPPIPSGVPPTGWSPAWSIEGPSTKYQYFVDVNGDRQERQLEDGRFDWDLPSKVVPDSENGIVWLQTPAGPRKYERKTKENEVVWEEVFGDEDQYRVPTIDPLLFDGDRFACRREPRGLWPTADQTGATLEMKLGGTSVVLKPGDNSKGAGFAHDVINDVAVLGKELWLATDGGAVRIDRLPDMSVAEIAGPDQGLTDDDLVAILVEDGLLVARSKSGDYSERPGAQQQAKWETRAKERGEESFRRADSIEQYNALLDNWKLGHSGPDWLLQVLLNGQAVPVSLGTKGFGFDQPRAFSLTANRIRLWTVDGLAELNRAAPPGPLVTLDPAQQLPEFEGYADILEDLQGRQPWLRSHAADPKTWRFADSEWQTTSVQEYDRTLVERRPLLLDEDGIKWDRRDQVTFKLPNLNQGLEFTTRFDVTRGRFLLNVPWDFAVFAGNLWVLTPGGIVQMDPQKRWSHVATIPVPDQQNSRLVTVTPGGRDRLVAVIAGAYHEWSGQAWQPPAARKELADAVARADELLVDGSTWQVKTADVQGDRRRMTARLNQKQEPQEVVLDPEGLFDFERVHSVIDDGAACISATDFGLIRSDPTNVDFTHLWRQQLPADRVGRLDRTVYARLTSGEELAYDAVTFKWQSRPGNGVFRKIDSQLVDEDPWSWFLEDGQHRVLLHPDPNGIWQGTGPLPVGLAGGRFGFDAVYDVGQHDTPWLVTEAGLLSRQGAGLVGISAPRPFQPRAAGGERSLFSITAVQTPVLFADSAGGLLRCSDNKWVGVLPEQVSAIQTLRKTQEARSLVFDVTRLPDERLAVGLHLPDDPGGLYKSIEFDPALGLFTFDDLKLVTRRAGQDVSVLAGTSGGVPEFRVGRVDDAAPFRRLFCDARIDGIGPAAIDGILLGKRTPVNLLVARDTSDGSLRYYKLGDGRWGEDQFLNEYQLERRTIAFDPAGWQVLALTDALDQSLDSSGFDMQWREEPVRLVNLRDTEDAAEDITRFAHDVPLSVSVTESDVWVATRGGVVAFPVAQWTGSASAIDLAEFDLHARDVLTPGDLRGTRSPGGVVFVGLDRTGGQSLYTRRADGTVLQYDPSVQNASWMIADSQSAGFRSACRVAKDSFWAWVKDGLGELDDLKPTVDPARTKVPDDYTWLTAEKGTWKFLVTDLAQPREPRRTILFFQGYLYMATLGGVARFPAPDGPDSVWPGESRDFIDTVYAVAVDDTGGEVSMGAIEELFWDEKDRKDTTDDRLHARSADGRRFEFDASRESWSVCSDVEGPFPRDDIVVENPLFTWALTENAWRLQVVPLREDSLDQRQYPLFADGRFAFDDVRHFSAIDDRLWLATAGGVCVYDSKEFSPDRFYAASLQESPDQLPNVSEIVSDDASGVYCRLRREDDVELTFTLAGQIWMPSTEPSELSAAESVFLAKYQRGEDRLMRLIQYPCGALEAHLKDPEQDAVLGKARGTSSLPLFANDRFSFDDVRFAALAGDSFWAATAAGVVEYRMDWKGERATVTRVYCYPSDPGKGAAMAELEGIARFPHGELLAWGGGHVFHASTDTVPSPLCWSVLLTGGDAEFHRQMVLLDGQSNWVLRQDAAHEHAMQLFRLPEDRLVPTQDDRPHSIAANYHSLDMSTARVDDKWIYQKVNEGGVIRIPKSAVD